MKMGDLVKHKETGVMGMVTYVEQDGLRRFSPKWIFMNVYCPDGSTHCWEINDCEVVNEV